MDNPRTPSTPSKRLEAARQKLTPSRSTSAVRNELRERFLTRLKHSRCRSYDKIRKIVDAAGDNLSAKMLQELRDILKETNEADFLTVDEVVRFLDNIKVEIYEREVETQAEQYEQLAGVELEDVIDRHFNRNCASCGEATTGEDLCRVCQVIRHPSNEYLFNSN